MTIQGGQRRVMLSVPEYYMAAMKNGRWSIA